ncbi:TetR/AcrR family transcriptional regulator [Pseudomonas sp. NPDC088368]|uniref:TetR/AcrR family transcriptional regulator n=1 Tax=Pseudomonas sp. NPDC088368 TaxID=3364453 RepID=UPI0038171443
MRYSAEQIAERRQQILHQASILFRRHGFVSVSVSDVMKATGLTHGGFYNYFRSKDDLIESCLAYVSECNKEQLEAGDQPEKALVSYLQSYLSEEHRDDVGAGCFMAALGSEIGRQPVGKAAFTEHLEAVLDHLAPLYAELDSPEPRAESIRMVVNMVGALTLARAVNNERLSDEILREARDAH